MKKTKKNIRAQSYIVKKYGIDLKDGSPIEIPNTDRITLAHLFKELGFKRGVEVGVQEGIYSEVLLQANPKLKLYGVDPWTFYETAGNFRKKEQMDAFYKTAVKRLTPYKGYTIIKKASMEAVKDFEDDSLDFVYIDANHEYSHVFQDIVEWNKKIKKGGIISGDDYRRSIYKNTKLHVVFAVNDYVKEYKIKHWFILGRKKIIEGEKRDKFRSWFWIKDGLDKLPGKNPSRARRMGYDPGEKTGEQVGGMKKTISICVASRKRPDMFKRMCESVLSLADNPNEIEFLICRDKDDDSIYEYLGNYRVFVDDRASVEFRLNEAWKSASGDIYGFNADDILFETKGWDTMVVNKFNEYPDRIVYVYPNNHYSRSNFGIIGFVHKNWTDTVGYFIKPDFVRRADCWLNALSKYIGRRGYISSFGIKNINILDDEVHREYIDYAEQVRDSEKYHSEEMNNQKIKDAKKLNDFINSYTG